MQEIFTVGQGQGTTTVIPPAPPRWWTVRDVAEYRGVTEWTIYEYVRRAKKIRAEGKEGGIPFSQPRGTGALRFKPEAIRRFFEDEE